MPRPTKLSLTSLEARDVPTVFGVPWGNAPNLTLSFAEDGVKASPIDGYGNFSISELLKELDTHIPRATWQTEVLRAFQTWAAPANINIGLVKDNGTSFGDFEADLTQTPNGELRIGAVPLSAEVAGITTPSHLLSGLRAGDVLLNTAHAYTVGGANGTRDLYTVMLNEAANALGLDDTPNPTSARYGRYDGVRTGLGGGDAAAIQQMYGLRQNDAHDTLSRNETFATATPLSWLVPGGMSVNVASAAGSMVAGEVDTYRLTSRGDSNTLNVLLHTAGRSLFVGTVEVFDAAQRLVASRAVTSPLTGSLAFDVANVARNATYFVRVRPTQPNAFGVGTYHLLVGSNVSTTLLPAALPAVRPPAYQWFGSDSGTDNTVATARSLTYTTPGYAAGTHFTARATVSSTSDRDVYGVTVPATSRPLSVVLNPLKGGQFTPGVRVLRASGAEVPATRLVQTAGGRWVAQVPGLAAGERVFLQVGVIPGTGNTGDYELIADFTSPAVGLRTLAAGNLSAADPSHTLTMTVPESTFFHFNLEAWNVPALGAGTHARMTIRTAGGQTVAGLTAGGTGSLQVFLPAGTYTVSVQGVRANGSAAPGASYRWSGARLSDPIDVFDPLDQGTQTPPVTIAPPTADDQGVFFVNPTWSDPIG